MTYGVTPTGFNKKTLDQILADIGDAQRATFGAAFDTSPSTPQGQLNATFASALAEVWTELEKAYQGFDPDASTDYLLTVLAGLTGTERRPAVASMAILTLNLNAGATVNAGSLVAQAGRPDVVFALLDSVTNTDPTAGNFPVAARCTQTGKIPALAGSLTVIVNAVSGWNSVTNAADAVEGRDVDDDPTLRARREDQLALRGGSTVAAIKADLLDVENTPGLSGMRDVSVIENTSDAVVGGMSAHSFEALIDDGDVPSVSDDLIAQIIWDGKGAGIRTAGSASGTATEDNGDPQTVYFSRAILRPVFITLSITTTADFDSGTGPAAVKLALKTAGDGYKIGDLVLALHLRVAALSVPGVVDVPTFTLGFAPSPAGTSNLDPGLRARATFDSLNITIL